MFITRTERFSGIYQIDGEINGRTALVQWEIPVFLKWKFITNRRIDAYLSYGFGFITVVDNSYSLHIVGDNVDENESGEFIDKKTCMGFFFGFGMNYFLKKRMISLDFRFSFGDNKEIYMPNPINANPLMSGDIEFKTWSYIIGYYF